jgi:DNA-directed RNA polymerase subunit RPC12/RpoP
MDSKTKCPRCKDRYLRYPAVRNAISRRDNKTYICSECGTEEALIDARMLTVNDIETNFLKMLRRNKEASKLANCNI